MKNTQLRTGNLVLYKGEVKTVDGILRGHVCLLEHSKDGKYGNWIDLDEIEFIPLTEDWLRKASFKHNSYDVWYIKIAQYAHLTLQKDFLKVDMREFDMLTVDDHDLEISCKYVHQLQNLYFALTGSELTKTP